MCREGPGDLSNGSARGIRSKPWGSKPVCWNDSRKPYRSLRYALAQYYEVSKKVSTLESTIPGDNALTGSVCSPTLVWLRGNG